MALHDGTFEADVTAVATMDEVAGWMEEHDHLVYAGFVRICQIRVLVEQAHFEEVVHRYAVWSDVNHAGGDALMTAYMRSLASVAFLEHGAGTEARNLAEASIRSYVELESGVLVDYAIGTFAASMLESGRVELAGLAMSSIDPNELDLRSRLDRWLGSTRDDVAALTELPEDDAPDMLVNLRRLVSELDRI